MIVWKEHGISPDIFEITHIESIGRQLFGKDCKFRSGMRRIKDHYHFHVGEELRECTHKPDPCCLPEHLYREWKRKFLAEKTQV